MTLSRPLEILGLDLGATTGWAHSAGISGTFDFKILKDESSGMRLLRFRAKLIEFIENHKVQVVAFETVSVAARGKSNTATFKQHAKMQAMIELLAVEMNFDHCSFNNATIKKRCGAKDKAGILEAARKHWPDQDIKDDNQADALWCLLLAQEQLR
tara:strand:+ start:3124 stop:3591 length:468 start_codon:yes stop_codon:yes gene_type:complete